MSAKSETAGLDDDTEAKFAEYLSHADPAQLAKSLVDAHRKLRAERRAHRETREALRIVRRFLGACLGDVERRDGRVYLGAWLNESTYDRALASLSELPQTETT